MDAITTSPDTAVPDLLNKTFHAVDGRLLQLAEEDKTHSGCTAVTAFLRLEEDDGNPDKSQGFVNPAVKSRGLLEGKGIEELEKLTAANRGGSGVSAAANATNPDESISSDGATVQRRSSRKMIKDFVKNLTSSKDSSDGPPETMPDPQSESSSGGNMIIADGGQMVDLIDPPKDKHIKRVLYTANVGDARAVLWSVYDRPYLVMT